MTVEQRKSSRRIGCLAIGMLGVIAMIYFHSVILIAMAKWLDVGQRPRSADYVMVLPGGPDRRPFVAASMIKRGLANGVLTAETETSAANDEGLYPTPDDVMRRILRTRGVHDDQIHVLPGHSESTWTDAQALAKFMKKNPQVTVAIVTDGYHTRRSRWVFQRVLGSDAERVYFVSAPLDTVSTEEWWKTEDGLLTYFSEYGKLALYLFTDQLVIGWLVGGCVLIVLWRIVRRRRKSIQPELASNAS